MKTHRHLVSAFALFLALFAGVVHAAPPTGAANDNGAYVLLQQPPEQGGLSFRFGWNNTDKFEGPVEGYWLGLYDVTNSHYVWVSETLLSPLDAGAPGVSTLERANFEYDDPESQLPPGDYLINFFVRSDYSTVPVTNNAVVQLEFSVR